MHTRYFLSLFTALTLGAAWLPNTIHGQRPEIGFARRDSVVIAVPFAAATEWKMGGFLGTAPRFVFDVSRSDAGEVVVKDSSGTTRSDWRVAGFPSVLHFVVEQVNAVRRPGGVHSTELVLRSGAVAGRMFIPEGSESVVGHVLVPLAKADSMYKANYRAIGDLLFTGPLASFTESERNVILAWAHLTAGGSFVGRESYRGANYLTVNVPTDGSVWNDLVVRQNQRIGKILSDRFPMMKAFARLTIPHEAIGGVKLSTTSCHGHAPNYTDMKCDPVEIYFPVASLVRFADDEITNQQLVNESVVRLAGDRIEVDLSNQ